MGVQERRNGHCGAGIMHLECLTPSIAAIWDQLGNLPDHMVLVGGTALAVQWGHRVSYDLDFATSKGLPHPMTLLRALDIPVKGDRYKWPRKGGTRPYIHIREGADTPKIDIHGKIPWPCFKLPNRASNGLLIAHPLDIIARKAIALSGRRADRDAIDICEWAKNPTDVSLSDALDVIDAMDDSGGSDLSDLACTLLDETRHADWDRAGVDLDVMVALGNAVKEHRPRAIMHAHDSIDGGLGGRSLGRKRGSRETR